MRTSPSRAIRSTPSTGLGSRSIGRGWSAGSPGSSATPWEQRPELAIVFEGEVVGRAILDVDRANVTAALGYGVARAHWGRGIASEAARAIVDYGFEAFSLAKVWARADPRNGASVRVLEKIGMQREGLLRGHLLVRGERVDRAYYGILREEWEAGRLAGR